MPRRNNRPLLSIVTSTPRVAAGLGAILICAFPILGPARADDSEQSLATRSSLLDEKGSPKDLLRQYGILTDVWVTQVYQGLVTGEDKKTWRYGGKTDGFLKVDGEKLGLWHGLAFSAQYEHYFGQNVNGYVDAALYVNTLQGFVRQGGYHSALSMNVSQTIDDKFTISVGKFNMITAPMNTPIVGGGGWETFMNIGLADPVTGVLPAYIVGGMATLKTDPVNLTFMLYDPRNAQSPRVVERPFEKGVAALLAGTVPTEIAGLNGYHTFRGIYSNKRSLDFADLPQFALPPQAQDIDTKKGYLYISYALQQYLVQSASDPSKGWGLFTHIGFTNGNPNPVRWSLLAGIGGNALLPGRENDRWGIGYFHYGVSESLLGGLAALDVNVRGESGIEAFYNYAVTPWLRLSADMQIIEPVNRDNRRSTFMGLRLQTKL